MIKSPNYTHNILFVQSLAKIQMPPLRPTRVTKPPKSGWFGGLFFKCMISVLELMQYSTSYNCGLMLLLFVYSRHLETALINFDRDDVCTGASGQFLWTIWNRLNYRKAITYISNHGDNHRCTSSTPFKLPKDRLTFITLPISSMIASLMYFY